MRLTTLLFASLLIVSCQGEKKTGGPSRADVGGPSRADVGGPSRADVGGPSRADVGRDAPPTGISATVPAKPKPAPYMQTPTLPVSPNAKPLNLTLKMGGSLILPKGTREIRVDDHGDDKPVVRHYYLNHPHGRGLKVTEYPLRGRPCEAMIASREAAFEAGYAKQSDPTPEDLQRFHKGARCELARAACYFSDTSQRTAKELEKGVRLHREAAFLLCKDDVAIAVAWKVPDGAEVDTGIIDALTRIAGTFTTR